MEEKPKHSGLVLGAPLTERIDPEVVYRERIGDRAIVYLDHNAWIELRDVRTQVATTAVKLARNAAAAGRAVFPCS